MIYEFNHVLRRCQIRIWISKSLRRSRGKKHSKEKISKIITIPVFDFRETLFGDVGVISGVIEVRRIRSI